MEELLVEQLITKNIIAIFNGSDKHQWETVRHSLADEVLLDYSSMSGQPAAPTKADDIIAAWSGFLPKFAFTLHFLSNFEIHIQGGIANVFCKGSAIHHLPNAEGGDVWKVYGTYEFELAKLGEQWKTTSLKFNLLYQEGNLNLPELAAR
ncbi:nuclear transport factor 2 family protein [Runella sp.]|uniref:nuclear transport factor 2 family protein n=1 Tax=Runella sp. TaxID=1960881 RepID=UPI003D0ADC2A